MATASFDPADLVGAAGTPQEASVALSKTPQTYLQLLALLGQAAQAVQAGAGPQQTTAILQQCMTLVSSLSVAMLVPDVKPSYDETTLRGLGKLNLRAGDADGQDDHDGPYDGSTAFHAMHRSSSSEGSSFSTTPSSPPSPPSPALSGSSSAAAAAKAASSGQAVHRAAPGTPRHTLLPPGFASALLTPPSEQKSSRMLNIHAQPVVFRPDGELVIPGLDELPAGFQSSLVPSTSDSDFQARAAFHRKQGRGVTEAYDVTLTLLGATTIDGVTFNFKVVDAFFNIENFNYSESLQTASGVTGYRYDNRNGSTYVRFDEPTGPRTQFVRHAHPPFALHGNSVHSAGSQHRSPALLGSPFVGSSSSSSNISMHAHHPHQLQLQNALHQSHQHQQAHHVVQHSTGSTPAVVASPTPKTAAHGLGFANLLPTPESSFARSASSSGKFSVHDLWN